MLLILSASSMQRRLKPGPGAIDLLDLPRFAREQLNLFGLHLPTSMLAGRPAATVDKLRDQADKNACPCLVLEESDPQPIAGDDDAAEAGLERMQRVIQAGHRLGCNAVAFRISARDGEQAFEDAVDNTKRLLERADRLEMNLLLAPHAGLTGKPDRLTQLVKKIGGFRIGTLPDFQAAADTGSAVEALRRLTPYASAVVASALTFDAAGKHEQYDLAACFDAVQSVGFEGALSIEYRGKGDPAEGVRKAREIFERAIAGPQDDADLDDLDDAELLAEEAGQGDPTEE